MELQYFATSILVAKKLGANPVVGGRETGQCWEIGAGRVLPRLLARGIWNMKFGDPVGSGIDRGLG